MAGSAMNIIVRTAALALSLLLAACGSGAGNGAAEQGPLAGARIGGPFTLTDQDGKRVSDTAFAGRYRLVYFGYTYCPDVCPVDLQKLMAGLRALEKSDPAVAARIQPLLISIDPDRDTPAVLKSYVAAFHPRLIGLTGTPAEIAAVARAFGVYYQKQQADGGAEYLVDHSRATYLFGPDGKPIALIPEDGTPAEIAAELKRWAGG
ncbi:SCO family protein [Sphingomonas flavalba]|uniref:SCO family protein n=1 Tax=Sphingomonas flavalba TaxID=2559804 RepID=UPI0039E160F1